jgi:predicted enzyme related to lactoylglutathione lyase
VSVTETFFSVHVEDMQRASAFYVHALGATVVFSSAGWSSLRIAEVRVGLALAPEHVASRVGLHFEVSDLTIARDEVERAGGFIASSPVEVAPGVVHPHGTGERLMALLHDRMPSWCPGRGMTGGSRTTHGRRSS